MEGHVEKRSQKSIRAIINKEMLSGWRIYYGEITNKIPPHLEVVTYDDLPGLVFVRDKIINYENK